MSTSEVSTQSELSIKRRLHTRILLISVLGLIFIGTSFIGIFSGPVNWDIANGFGFRPSGSGWITFGSATTAATWSNVGTYVSFTSLTVGAGDTYTTLELACASNNNISLTNLETGTLTFSVDSDSATGTTYIVFPSAISVTNMTGQSWYTFVTGTRLLTVTTAHGGQKEVVMYFSPYSAPPTPPRTNDLTEAGTTWAEMMSIIIFVASMSLMAEVSSDKYGEGPLKIIMQTILSTAVILALFWIVEGFFS